MKLVAFRFEMVENPPGESSLARVGGNDSNVFVCVCVCASEQTEQRMSNSKRERSLQ